jgi:MoaA/NifB/PqqE/SkfB family radical SAM enzyme
VLEHKDNLKTELKERINSFNNNELKEPVTIQFSFDRTCNLKCPSCRVDLIVEDSKGIERVKKTIDEIQLQYGQATKILYITGTGDPFVSVGFRDFLRNFDSTKWPALQKIHLHTNATKWNKEMWDSMTKVHKYVKSCEISIDAGTKETYETKTRIGGNWDNLISNLKFISTIPKLNRIKTSFVVQKENYKEMKQFYDLMISIFGKRADVFYGKINNWGTFSEKIYNEHKIWDTNHPEHDEFINVVNSFLPTNQCWHNLQEFIKEKKDL